MGDETRLAERFEANRNHLLAVAYRMLGSRSEAEDAVQEAWLRLASVDADSLANLRGWLTTIVARICIDILRSRKMRREDPLERSAESLISDENTERQAALADSIGVAMLVVLETLTPAERVAFVLHDMFDTPFEDIGAIINRTPVAARQLASRARRRVRGGSTMGESDRARQRSVVEAFLAAAQNGEFAKLLALLDPQATLRADAAAIAASRARAAAGAPALRPEIHGPSEIAATFSGRAHAARLAFIDGEAGLVFAPGGKPIAVFDFVVDQDRIVEISLIADPQRIGALSLQFATG